jgi:hypothetical protein
MFHKILVVASLVACSGAWAQAASFSLPADARFILSPDIGPSLLQQCSRNAPEGIKEFWLPSAKDISNLERKLVPYLATRAKSGAAVPPQDVTYHRQYVGLVRDGVRLIYGNFYPGGAPHEREKKGPAMVCDGGPAHWGIVFNPSTGHFEDPEFNGSA